MENRKITYMVYTALMAALIFVATYLIKIPNPATGGYSHMGDCMIFIAVVMLGRRNGSMAAAIGGGSFGSAGGSRRVGTADAGDKVPDGVYHGDGDK